MAEISKPSGVDLNKVWGRDNPETPPSDSKIATGWVVEIPDVEDFQWLDNKMDTFIAHVNQHGIPEWDSATEYQANKSYIMGSNGTIYRCILTHTNKNPVSAADAATYWREAFDAADTSYTKSESDTLFARRANNLSDLNNAPAARTNLGLGTAATRNVGTSAGNVLQVGSFGIGSPIGNWSNTSLNNYVLTQWTATGPTAPNAPLANRYGYLFVQSGGDANWVYQEWRPIDGYQVFFRRWQNGSWTSWYELFSTANFNPATKLNTTGGTLTGREVISYNPPGLNFNQGHLELYTDNTSWPFIGFHRAGLNGLSLFMNDLTQLGIRDSGGAAGILWDSRQVSYSAAQNGFIRFPNGFILQWGYADPLYSGNAVHTLNVTLPTTFPNTCLASFVSTRTNTWSNGFGNTSIYAINNSQLQIQSAGAVTFRPGVHWFALGF